MKLNTKNIFLIVVICVLVISVFQMTNSEYFWVTSKEGTGVLLEVRQATKYSYRGRVSSSSARKAVLVYYPIISFKNPENGKDYSFVAQEHRYRFEGSPGQSFAIRYKIKNDIAEGIIENSTAKRDFFSRNKIELIYIVVGGVLIGLNLLWKKMKQ